jgi:hypothetical protein
MSVWEKLLKKALDTLQLETQRELVWINHKSMPATIGSDLNFRAVSPIMLLSSGGAKTINLNTHMLAPENFHGPLAQSALNNFATKPEMLIWVAYSKVPGAAESTLAKVETIAKNLGFGYIVFHSPRDGWKRRAKALGFTLRERVYEKKLD